MPVERRGPLLAGVVAGLAAWLVGYLCTYVVVAPGVRESALNRIVGAFEGDPATPRLVGWVFYNAHLVETAVRGVPLVGGGSTSFVGGDGFTPLLYLVPAGLLAAAGVALARWRGATDPAAGAVDGLAALPGYMAATLAGVFLFAVDVGGVTGRPALVPAVVLAGAVYPLAFAGGGGAVAALTAD